MSGVAVGGSGRGERPELPSLGDIVYRLRRAGNEVQLTQTLSEFLRDPLFAHEFLDLALRAASRAKTGAGRKAGAFRPLDGDVICRPEEQTGRGTTRDRGRCDLWFEVGAAKSATVAVEIKISARYTKRQRERYISELRKRASDRRGLLVITTLPPTPVSPALRVAPEWLGEVLWADLDELGLANLRFSDPAGPLPDAWRAVVDALRAHGDLGGLASVDVHELATWTGDNAEAKSQAVAFLEAIAEDADAALRAKVAARGLEVRRRRGTTGSSRVHSSSRSYIALSWGLSERGSETVELVILRGESGQKGRQIALEVWFYPRPAQRRASLEPAAGFELDKHYEGGWCRSFVIPLDDGATPEQVEAAVLRHWRTSLSALDRSEAFRTLLAS